MKHMNPQRYKNGDIRVCIAILGELKDEQAHRIIDN